MRGVGDYEDAPRSQTQAVASREAEFGQSLFIAEADAALDQASLDPADVHLAWSSAVQRSGTVWRGHALTSRWWGR